MLLSNYKCVTAVLPFVVHSSFFIYSNPYYDGKTRWRLASASSLFSSLGSDHTDCSVFYSCFFPACCMAEAHILPFARNPLPFLLPWFLITRHSLIHMSFLQASLAQLPCLAQLASIENFCFLLVWFAIIYLFVYLFNVWIPHEIISFMKARIRSMFFGLFIST